MKKKLYQKPNIKVHDLPMDALLAASGSFETKTTWDYRGGAIKENPTGDGMTPTINSKRGNLWGDDEE